MTESNANRNVESTSSSPVASDEVIKDLDVRVSDEQLNNVKGGSAKDAPKETVTFEYGGLQVQYGQQQPNGKLI